MRNSLWNESCESIKSILDETTGWQTEIKLNENRFHILTMKYLKKSRKRILSLHKVFLEAPKDIIAAIGNYFHTKDASSLFKIKQYMQLRLKVATFPSKAVKPVITQGSAHNLLDLYNEVNERYFSKNLSLQITWYGKLSKRKAISLTLGLYDDQLKLIKIHRCLDESFIPRYFISYVIYHEMLHYVVPPYFDDKGRLIRHGKEFKKMEKKFDDYERANLWLRKNKKFLR